MGTYISTTRRDTSSYKVQVEFIFLSSLVISYVEPVIIIAITESKQHLTQISIRFSPFFYIYILYGGRFRTQIIIHSSSIDGVQYIEL
jgi:hypothetical protein